MTLSSSLLYTYVQLHGLRAAGVAKRSQEIAYRLVMCAVMTSYTRRRLLVSLLESTLTEMRWSEDDAINVRMTVDYMGPSHIYTYIKSVRESSGTPSRAHTDQPL